MKLSDLHEAVKTCHPKNNQRDENKISTLITVATEVADIIKAEASEMLKAYRLTNGFLYRGRSSSNEVNGIPEFIKIRPDRKPVDMEADQHELLHTAFQKSGLEATRKNGIFCSAKLSIARDWGNRTTIIFVKDGWTGTVFDKSKNDYAFHELRTAGFLQNKEKDKIKNMQKVISDLEGRSFDTAEEVAELIDNDYMDVIITGDSYLALDIKSRLTKEVLKILGLE